MTTTLQTNEFTSVDDMPYGVIGPYERPLRDLLASGELHSKVDLVSEADMQPDGYLSTTHGVHVVYVHAIGRAAVNAWQGGDWQWTDASSVEDAIRRYREDDLSL